ncbi:MAG: LLM class flavin-dependent oxidoreductase, partial [Actinomycetota bacterium]|nr:LLM class flavin-dependent oxidoreductase [Actinomycetota bacterium]
GGVARAGGGGEAPPLSVLDQVPIPAGSSAPEALAATVELAQAAERLGYRRYWVAEHHNTESLASSAPEVLVAHLAASTTSIRVGAGGILLSHYSPLKVAEVFRTLHALHPGRIDLGVGRAAGTDDAAAAALAHGPGALGDEHHPDQLATLVGFVHDRLAADHPFAEVRAMPTAAGTPEMWVLGSSSHGSSLAAGLGLPFAFAHFVSPTFCSQVVASYRRRFRPSRACPRPRVAIGVSVVCAATDAEAERLVVSHDVWRLNPEGAERGPLLPVADASAWPLNRVERARLAQQRDQRVVGAPDRVRAALMGLAADTGADELVVLTVCHDAAARLRSYELLAATMQR